MRLIILCITNFLFLMSPTISASDKETASLWDNSKVTFNKFLKCQVIDKNRLLKGYKIGAEIEVAYNSSNGEVWTQQRAIRINNKGEEIRGHGSTRLDEANITFSFKSILITASRLNYDRTTTTTLMLPIDRGQLTVTKAIILNEDRDNFDGECSPADLSEAFEWTQIDRQI